MIRFFISAGLLTLTLLCWAFASPIGASPDDDFHLVSSWCGRGQLQGQCEVDLNQKVIRVPQGLSTAGHCYRFRSELSAACTQAVNSDALLKPWVSSERNNTIKSWYPRGYYYFMSLLVGRDVIKSVLTMRILNLSLAVVIWFTLIFLTTNTALEDSVRISLLVTSVPLGLFLIPSNNPSSWTIISISSFWAFLYLLLKGSFLVGWEKKLTILCCLLTAGLGIYSRVDGSIYLLISMALTAYLVGGNIRDTLRHFILKPWSWILILIVSTAVVTFLFQGSGVDILRHGFVSTADSINMKLFFSNLIRIPTLWFGAIGGWGLGWLDTRLPRFVPFSVTIIASTLIAVQLRCANRHQGTIFAIGLLTLFTIPLSILTRSGLSVGEQVQPRYLLPLLYFLVGLSLIKENPGEPLKIPNKIKFIFACLLSLSQSIALHINLRRYITGMDVKNVNLNTDIEWWWPQLLSPMIFWLVGSITFFILALIVFFPNPEAKQRRNNQLANS